MNIELIAIDVDGTLVKDDHLTIPPINIESIRMAKKKGIKIVISTGRSYSLTDKESAMLGCVDYLVLSNGAVVVDAKSLEVLYNCYLSVEALERIITIFEKYPLVYELYADCQGYINDYTYEHYFEATGLPEVFLRDYRKRMIWCDSPWDIIHTKNVEKVNVDYMPKECIEPLIEELKNIPGLVYSAGFVGNLEITADGADKGKALGWLADKIGVKPDKVMAFGDSENDVTMLRYAGSSYAMKNGNQKAKEAARYMTKETNNEGGVGKIINEYLTNQEK